MIDTGAARGNNTGKAHNLAYCAHVKQPFFLDVSRAAQCHFETGSTTSEGKAIIAYSNDTLWLSFDIHSIKAYLPMISSIDDMDRLSLYLNNLQILLLYQISAQKVPIV